MVLESVFRRALLLFVVGHEAKRSARLSVRKKTTGTDVPYYEREKPLFVVGHEAKRRARSGVPQQEKPERGAKRNVCYVPKIPGSEQAPEALRQ